jgi:hypothetical protein
VKAFVCALAFLVSIASGQQAPSDARPSFQAFRYDEDWSSLADSSKRSDWLDVLKYISLGRPGWFVTLGGEVREKFELLDQPGFGTGPKDDTGYFLQRYLLSSDFHFGPRLRFFTELQSGFENGRNGRPTAHGPRPARRGLRSTSCDTATRASCWPTASTLLPFPLASATRPCAPPPTSTATRFAARTTR